MSSLKEVLIGFAAVFGLFLGVTAHPVDQETAKAIAVKFMGTNDLELSTTYFTANGVATLYLFNARDGFVIVSADDCETPIIGYSHEGRLNLNDIPVQMEGYLQDFTTRIQYGIENHVVADEITERQWELVKATGRLNGNKNAKAVEPLVTTRWSQGCLYNSLCPALESQPCGHANVGCLAIAMGQIMNYWKHPQVGMGSHFYSSSYGMLSADFGHTAYHWDNMPETLTDTSSDTEVEAVATLLYHCGVSINMYYTNNGSVAYFADVPDALIHYFKYAKDIYREESDGDNAAWLAKLKASLDARQPVVYTGSGNDNHAFVCDGYDSNDMLHFNWGWGGNGDGYFALGNLNPLGNNFNSGNAAVFNIAPNNDTYHIITKSHPLMGGAVNGHGDYHIGDSCILTAVPAENSEFLYWKIDGAIVNDSINYSFIVENDIELEANFTFQPAQHITANYAPDANDPSAPLVSLSWENHDDEPWPLLKQFEVQGETGGMATDGEYIYVSYAAWNDTPCMIEKFTMDGDPVETINLSDLPDVLCLAYDGSWFYCNSLNSHDPTSVLFRIDLENKTVLDSVNMGKWFGELTYDPEYDGFWLGQNYNMFLYSRQGQSVKASPSTYPFFLNGSGYYTAEDGNPHLLLSIAPGVYDYDINNNYINSRPLLRLDDEGNDALGTCTGNYNGKDALFLMVGETVRIYEINSWLAQIIGYRLYRSDSEGNSIMLANEVGGAFYLDSTWNDLDNGIYRYGISSVYANGTESEILWSDPITKSNHGLEENLESEDPNVQKIFENGQIVIIKEGKRYNIKGQEIQ